MPQGKVTLVQKKGCKTWFVGLAMRPSKLTPEDAIYLANQLERAAKEAYKRNKRNKDDLQN